MWYVLDGSREQEPSCGRPLGIRVGPNGTLFVADAYLGLFEVNPVTGQQHTQPRASFYIAMALFLLQDRFSYR